MKNTCLLFVLLAAALIHGCAEPAPPRTDFEVVLIPDTQFYSEKFPETYLTQTRWIRDNAEARNIKFSIHLGDMVQNVASEAEWRVADEAHKFLDGVVPYSVLPGNHDLDYAGEVLTHNVTMYNKYFPPSRFEGNDWYGGHMGEDNACNYAFFEGNGLNFMVVSLAFAPNDAMIAWADEVIASHPGHRVILATHYYLDTKGRAKGGRKSTGGLEGANGEMLWDKLIRKHPNIFMVVCGHVWGTYRQTSTNDAGKPVLEILCDFQGEGDGGNGWLQTMVFMPEENKIHVAAYSPLLNEYRNIESQAYTVDYDMSSGENTSQTQP